MSALNNLLDKYKKACLLKSDSAVATSLGIKRQSVFQWRNGMAWPSDDNVIKMATAIREPAERWLATINMDRASPTAKKYWMKLLQAAAAIAAIYLFSRLDVQTHEPAMLSMLYIMRNYKHPYRWDRASATSSPPTLFSAEKLLRPQQ